MTILRRTKKGGREGEKMKKEIRERLVCIYRPWCGDLITLVRTGRNEKIAARDMN